jgi:hypothetical protein
VGVGGDVCELSVACSPAAVVFFSDEYGVHDVGTSIGFLWCAAVLQVSAKKALPFLIARSSHPGRGGWPEPI